MRTTLGILGAIGLGVTVAVGQSPVTPVAKPRAALLLPPTASTSDDTPALARGVSEEIPNFPMGTSPVAPPRTSQGLWGDGTDPNIRLASGVTTTTAAGTVTAPSVGQGDDPSALTRGIDKLKGAIKGNTSQVSAENDQPNANSPFRGTTVNGATVYAGPPAYRWYGYGTVTPGANPFAPTGQPPKASANWYSITGATPGAFPVPVTSPQRAPGSEPPTYVPTVAQRNTPSMFTPPALTQPINAVSTPPTRTELPRTPVAETKTPQPALVALPPVNTLPTATLPPPSTLAAPELPVPQSNSLAPTLPLPQPPNMLPTPNLPLPSVSTPQMPIAPTMPSEQTPATSHGSQALPVPAHSETNMTVVPTIPLPPEPLANKADLPLPPPEMSMPAYERAEQKPLSNDIIAPVTTSQLEPTPATLPVSVTDYQLKWQPTAEASKQGEWTTPGKTGTPQAAPAPATVPEPEAKQPGATDTSRPPIIARGQAGENAPDPVVTLIKKICTGRAEGTDVRWTGSKRLSVCFECKTKDEALQLVRDISARSELMPLRIDFCVLIK